MMENEKKYFVHFIGGSKLMVEKFVVDVLYKQREWKGTWQKFIEGEEQNLVFIIVLDKITHISYE